MLGLLKRTTLSRRQERAVDRTLNNIRTQRRNRFRILACIDGSEESYITVRWANKLAIREECDIIVLHVRPIDQGLHSGGLQVRLARQNMLDAGFELPGVRYLKQALVVLAQEGLDCTKWESQTGSQNAWGDAAGDTKVEYRGTNGKVVVLKLKTAPDVASGIIDQYELGPYNLMILGETSRWRSEFKSFFSAGVVQTVSTVAPCSVLVARNSMHQKGIFIYTDGSKRAMQAVRRAAVLAHELGEDITLFAVAETAEERAGAENAVNMARDLLTSMQISVAHAQVKVGKTVEEIVEAGSMSKIIVVTDEGRNRFQRLFKGSVASEVVRRARTSVLEVR